MNSESRTPITRRDGLPGDHLAFTQDYLFNSPSTAAGVVQGRSANGRIDWKDNYGKTLKDFQDLWDIIWENGEGHLLCSLQLLQFLGHCWFI